MGLWMKWEEGWLGLVKGRERRREVFLFINLA
jgi:hypothetical protein